MSALRVARGHRPAPQGPSPARRVLLERLALVLLVALALWWAADALLAVGLLTGALVAAVLLTALLAPLSASLCGLGLPRGVAAGAATLALLGALAGVALLVYTRAAAQAADLPAVLLSSLDATRVWLVDGPLALDPEQVSQLRDAAATFVLQATPTPLGGAMTALRVMSAAVLALFAVFFLLKDGPQMWRWTLGWLPEHRRERADRAGNAAWRTLSGYMSGIAVVAAVDALAIGGVLLVLGVPLAVSLALLTFVGAFVPLLGAFVTGAGAVLVTLATNGPRDAAVVLVAVLVVQQLEGNVLHPLVVGRAVHLHPLVVLVAVTAGVLLHGVAGALVAVPLVAVAHAVADALRAHDAGRPTGQPRGLRPALSSASVSPRPAPSAPGGTRRRVRAPATAPATAPRTKPSR